jgi:HEAT repeat protein
MPQRRPKPIDLFLSDLKNSDYKVRREAVKALRRSRNPDAFPHLAAALDDPAVSVVMHAIRGLEELGDLRAVPVLLGKLGGSSCDVCDEIGAALVSFREDAVPDLIVALEAEHPRTRAIAATALSRIGDPRAVEPLLRLLDDPDGLVLGAALNALWDFADERAREPLAAFVVRPDDAIPAGDHASAYERRRTAAFALAELGDQRAIDVLAQSFRAEPRLCVETIRQLGKIDDPRVRPLIRAYIEDDPDSLCASQARATLEHLDARR